MMLSKRFEMNRIAREGFSIIVMMDLSLIIEEEAGMGSRQSKSQD